MINLHNNDIFSNSPTATSAVDGVDASEAGVPAVYVKPVSLFSIMIAAMSTPVVMVESITKPMGRWIDHRNVSVRSHGHFSDICRSYIYRSKIHIT